MLGVRFDAAKTDNGKRGALSPWLATLTTTPTLRAALAGVGGRYVSVCRVYISGCRLQVVASFKVVVVYSPFPVGHSVVVIMGGSLLPWIRRRERVYREIVYIQ